MTPDTPRMRLELGQPVRCRDGAFGELADLVIDPTTKSVTHLVVRPTDPPSPGRLVPITLATPADGGELALACTAAEARALESVQEFAYLRVGAIPVDNEDWDVGVQDVLAAPYYTSPDIGGYVGPPEDPVGVTYDRVPKGEVEIRRQSAVMSSDGHHLGHVDGFVVDDAHITHLVLERGHLWRRRDVTIPIGAATEVETDTVKLALTKDEVGELPAIPVHRLFS